ncbi:MAG: Stp1/IreP family PP2C-type Ser/Thr phosphatase [Gemmatimonadetes bacterium]|nr:Stp1/IreP family PP2C-type Ser/Thr phosphatase [Gemmatimonadota bacterium]MCC6770374.1 Stp1/IreP family PP2C-type Ser/Thr phosphatase [Gemmatimonadaceae bacterium]
MSFLGRLFSRNPTVSPAEGAARPTAELGRWSTPALQATELRIEGGLATDPGCVREINEDFARIIRPTTPAALHKRGVLAVVCDGMGGHEAGEIASRLAVETIVRRFEEDELAADPVAAVPRSVQAANRAIFDAAERNHQMRGMGTTCTVLLLRDGMAYGAHVGDSRIYLIRGGDIFLMTEDHSAVMELVRRGVITRDEARHHPDKNVISRALGSHRDVQVTGWPQPFAVLPGDRFLLCTDGLYDLVDDEQLLATARDVHPQVACDRLITLAREAGGHDNISVAILVMSTPHESTSAGMRETRAIEIPQ